MRILVTGGAGYCGSRLCTTLLAHGHEVIVYDIMWFGCALVRRPGLTVISADIRNTERFARACERADAVVHLACVSNDASFELDEALSTSINLDAFEPLVIEARDMGVKRFVYVSSSSVYGVSSASDVREDHPLVPLTLYNKYKGMCEPLLFKHTSDEFIGVVLRPATVCGYSIRQRLDLAVNILTNHAVNTGRITVFGGTQMRPNLHIQDYCDAIELVLGASRESIQNEIFNVGYQNLSLMEIAHLVSSVVREEYHPSPDIEIVARDTNDVRSYHINSDKIARVLGFVPKHTIEDAVRKLCDAFKAGRLPNSMKDDRYFNVARLKRIGAY